MGNCLIKLSMQWAESKMLGKTEWTAFNPSDGISRIDNLKNCQSFGV